MPKTVLSNRVVELPPARRQTHNYLDLYWWKHSIYALLEVDVTDVRRFIEEHEAQTGEALSFTGYVAFCLSRAVDEDKLVQAYLKGRKHMVIFDDVDVFLPVEREVGKTPVALPHLIRRANHMSFLEIHREIREFQTGPVPQGSGTPAGLPAHDVGALAAAPAIRAPHPRSQSPGSHACCDGGRNGRCDRVRHGRSRRRPGRCTGGQSLLLIVGGIARKPAVIDERVEPRDLLDLTVAFDHDVVDGAPAARFVKRLVDLIESGYGLEQVRQEDPAPAGPT